MTETKAACSGTRASDWSSNRRTLTSVWGLPALAMLAAVWLEAMPRAAVWSVMLIWMGGACLANAWRCGRTHCRFTGPFFLVMAALVVAHAAGVLQLGPHGWVILAGVTLVGNTLIWWWSERVLGTFWRAD